MKKEIKTRQQLIERLNEIDRRCIDSNRHFHDLRTLFEAKEYKLSAQDKADIKKVASIEDDPDTLKAYIDSKAIEEDFEQDWDPEDYAGGYTEWDLIDSKRTTEGESYNLWYNEFKDKWVCTSGDSDIYYPENVPEYDAEFEDEDEAREWFEDCTNGSCDEEDLELVTDDMNGGQWFESLNEKFSPFAVFDKYGFKQFDADTEEQALSYMNKYKKDGNILVNAKDKVVAVQKYKKGKWTLEKDVNEEIDLNNYNDGYVEVRDGKPQFIYSTLKDAKNGMFWSQMGDSEHGLGKHSYEIKKWENGVLKDLNESRIPRTVEFGKEGHYAPPARGTISDISELNVGDRIYHSSYNLGTVDKIKDNKAYVKFDNYKGVRIFPNNAVQYLSKVDRPHISEEFNEMPEKSFLPPTGIGWFDKMYRELSDEERWQMNHIIKNIFYVRDDELPSIDEDTLDRIVDKFLDTTIDESYEDGEYDYFVVYKGETLQGEYPTYGEAKRNAGEGCIIKGVIQYGGSEYEETNLTEESQIANKPGIIKKHKDYIKVTDLGDCSYHWFDNKEYNKDLKAAKPDKVPKGKKLMRDPFAGWVYVDDKEAD